MSKTLRQHKIAALKEAKRVIQDNYACPRRPNASGSSGICRALGVYAVACSYESIKSKAVRELKSYISDALGIHSFLNGWVQRNSRLSSYPDSNNPKMVQTRLNWIDWMINCLEEDERNNKGN